MHNYLKQKKGGHRYFTLDSRFQLVMEFALKLKDLPLMGLAFGIPVEVWLRESCGPAVNSAWPRGGFVLDRDCLDFSPRLSDEKLCKTV